MQHNKLEKQELRLWGVTRKPRLADRVIYVVEHIIVLTALVLFLSFVQTATAAEPDYASAKQGTLFYRAAHDGQYRAAPLLDTDVDMRVTGYINRARLTQTFTNGSDEWMEGIYVFPLPENAAVDHMRIRVGERIIEGQIKEKAEAKQIYEQAKRAGKRASLLEQERPNMFTTSVANIGPHESIVVEIEYQQTLAYDQGQFRLRMPLAITPRYIPGGAPDEQALVDGTGFAQPTTQVPDANRITPPVALGQKINPVTIHIELDAGFDVSDLKSSYHPITISNHGEGRYTINLADGQVPSDHDFELVWTPVAGQAPQAALFSERIGNEMFYLGMLLPPQAEQQTQTLAREVIYVIDTSGSMGGVSIRQARDALMLALKRLRGDDYFNVIQFNSVTDTLFDHPVPASLNNKTQALRYVENLQAGGGTEMMGAMQKALANNDDETQRLRQVIFLTDGAVGNEDALFEYIRHHLGNSRLFTVGIGSAPNSHFMTKAAQFGRGTFTYISRVNEVADKMQALFAKLDSPVMRDLAVEHSFNQFEMSPAHLPDLYLGEPLMFTARSDADSGELVLKGLRQGKDWSASMFLQQAKPGRGIAQLWARQRIDSLMDSAADGADAAQVRKQVIELALHHHMVSKYTSLVAVDVTPVRPQTSGLNSLAVPVNLPQGQDAAKIFGMQAQTGTAQNLFWLLGILLLSMALGLKWYARKGGQSWAA
ncbi:MAG: marine proteobacterial sortase target protein [Gammaproteobacteria bacterium]|nr:marine proteobacterial sortase target protein [Gammaproteobacteria bacterium]